MTMKFAMEFPFAFFPSQSRTKLSTIPFDDLLLLQRSAHVSAHQAASHSIVESNTQSGSVTTKRSNGRQVV